MRIPVWELRLELWLELRPGRRCLNMDGDVATTGSELGARAEALIKTVLDFISEM